MDLRDAQDEEIEPFDFEIRNNEEALSKEYLTATHSRPGTPIRRIEV
jgi:hypothetical protein